MFINISQKVRVYISDDQLKFLNKYSKKKHFLQSELSIDDGVIAKLLSAKSVLVRKKLAADTQYAVNRSIRIFDYGYKK